MWHRLLLPSVLYVAKPQLEQAVAVVVLISAAGTAVANAVVGGVVDCLRWCLK